MESSLASTNILLIDDDIDSLTTFETLLSNKGYSVETAETGAQALEKSRKKKFDLALIDITLPDMEGTKLLNTLSSSSEMRKIIITGKGTFDNAVDALNLGADAYLMKPVNPVNLLKVIEEQLQEKLDQSQSLPSEIDELTRELEKVTTTVNVESELAAHKAGMTSGDKNSLPE
ncbi:MAG: response regulator, partial [Thaumarchaeota archaeon]|nr:response regulator [Nitrososphaerota archaeon]